MNCIPDMGELVPSLAPYLGHLVREGWTPRKLGVSCATTRGDIWISMNGSQYTVNLIMFDGSEMIFGEYANVHTAVQVAHTNVRCLIDNF